MIIGNMLTMSSINFFFCR